MAKAKSRLAFDSNEYTEDSSDNISTGEEVPSEVEGPSPGDPKGNPHDYVDKTKSKDGVPFDKNNPEHLSTLDPTDPGDPEAAKPKPTLAGVVEHEGHSVGLHLEDGGFRVRGRGTTAYFQSEPISNKEHAEEFAKDFLKTHAKMSEREIVAKNCSLSEQVEERFDHLDNKQKRDMWEGLTGGATHKITACMNKIDGHVENPGAFCKSLADGVGYKPK